MRISHPLIIAGAVIAGLAGLAPTLARELDTHTLRLRLPGGGIETVEYTGKVAPKIAFAQIPTAGFSDDAFVDFAPVGFVPFLGLDRISEDMDRQMDQMLRQAQMLEAMPQGGHLDAADLSQIPNGTSVTIVSQTSDGACTRVTRMTRSADAPKPEIVSQTSGQCSALPGHAPTSSADVRTIAYPVPEDAAGPSLPRT